VKILKEHGAEVNARKVANWISLHDASEKEGIGIIPLLLAHTTDVNAKGDTDWTPLHWASRVGRLMIIRILLEQP
jgi:ankyrin repeat protein